MFLRLINTNDEMKKNVYKEKEIYSLHSYLNTIEKLKKPWL